MKLKELHDLVYYGDDLRDAHFSSNISQARPIIDKFCKKYGVYLVRIDSTMENFPETFKKEPLYIFSDKLGGYSLKGLKESIQ
jgi:hypothetical protein